jgi:putative transposase
MAWNERKAMEQRKSFIEEWLDQEEDLAELCRRYDISRPTGYKWIARFQAEGEGGLIERSRAPQHPHSMLPKVAAAIIELRHQHARWGPRKLLSCLQRDRAETQWPAASTIGELLRREGLVHARRRRRRTPADTQPLAHAGGPNQVWCADFKGWFACGDGRRCDPLTCTDAFSRYLLRCRAVEKADGVHVRAIFEAMFREYGLPDAIRTDNGTPFASRAPGGLSRLAMWWLRLGIRHERIDPGCPEQNGRHERMHKTLKAETASPPSATWRQQQQAFLHFEWEYNHVRPHQALDYRTPAELYVPSLRPYPARLSELVYPNGAQLRRISQQGSVRWDGERTFISEVLAREYVGLLDVGQQWLEVYYGPLRLGWLHGAKQRFKPEPPVGRRGRRKRAAVSGTPSATP